jgi:hypothetical protein
VNDALIDTVPPTPMAVGAVGTIVTFGGGFATTVQLVACRPYTPTGTLETPTTVPALSIPLAYPSMPRARRPGR